MFRNTIITLIYHHYKDNFASRKIHCKYDINHYVPSAAFFNSWEDGKIKSSEELLIFDVLSCRSFT
jgi:hypothetical protein